MSLKLTMSFNSAISWLSSTVDVIYEYASNGKYKEGNIAFAILGTLAVLLLVSAVRNYFLNCENHELHKELKQRRDEVKQKNEEIRLKDDEHKKLLMVNKLLRDMVEGDPYKTAKSSVRKSPSDMSPVRK